MKSGVKCAMGKSKAAVFITVLAVVLILFCALLYWNAGTAGKTEAQWDPRFLEALSLEQEEADRAGNDLVQTVEECVSSGAVSLELIQTAAGGDLICLYYELTLPENWTAAWSALHQDAGALAFEAQCSAAEGTAPDYRATAVTGFDAARGCVQCVSTFRFPDTDLLGETLTLTLGAFTLSGVPADAALPEEPLALSWTVQRRAEERLAQTPEGICALSPLGLSVQLARDEAPDAAGEVMASLQVVYRDGTVVHSLGPNSASISTAGEDCSAQILVLPQRGTLFCSDMVKRVDVCGMSFVFE